MMLGSYGAMMATGFLGGNVAPRTPRRGCVLCSGEGSALALAVGKRSGSPYGNPDPDHRDWMDWGRHARKFTQSHTSLVGLSQLLPRIFGSARLKGR